MFFKQKNAKNKDTKLSGPKDIPEIVNNYITATQIIDTGTLRFLKAVVKSSESGEKFFDICIFDPADAEAREIKVHGYDTVKANPELIIAEGLYNESEKKAELTVKKAVPKITFYTADEIQKQIEGLKEPGSSVFFYANSGTGVGGPLGRGAAVIRLNAGSNGNKVKKYSVYGDSVIDMQPVKKEVKIYDSDKAAEIADWVSCMHKPRFC